MDDPHADVEIKPQLTPRGSVAKEEDPKPSHQLYQMHIKSTRYEKKKKIHMINYVDSIYRIYKRSLRAPTKENVLVLIVVDIGGKNTEE